jgi:photosystem II stability/assembly factor-like uncharacterized protein
MILALLLMQVAAAASNWWIVQPAGVDSTLRGVSVVVRHGVTAIWATGSKGTLLLSTDAGANWLPLHIPDGETLDFRGVQAFDANTAYVMSSGDGDKSHIYKTTDGGKTWQLQYSDQRKSFFLDAIACRDATHCFALSDPVDGKFLLLSTSDGTHWTELARDKMPPAIPGEGAFAASNSSLLLYAKSEIYFATGGRKARVFHSSDLGKTWSVSETPILSGKASQGIFSIVRAGDTVVVMGGDYTDAALAEKTAAYSTDGGETWHLAADLPGGYRSSVDTYDYGFVAVGPNGTDTSHDGVHWKQVDSPELNAVTFDAGKGWAVGSHGVIARFVDHTAAESQQ